MLQKRELEPLEVEGLCERSKQCPRSIRVTVFTSGTCPFCDIALELVRIVARDMARHERLVTVVEYNVDDDPEIVEALDIVALPTILVGGSKIIGLPNADEVEDLIHGSAILCSSG